MTEYEFSFVHTVSNAEQVIADKPFDIYVLDNWLPDGSGLDLCTWIRSSDSSTPIIFTSAIAQRHEIDRAIEAGANRYIVKPYEPDTLLRTVKELLLESASVKS
jgi:DNA-binding response OmpR family regulator